MAENTQAEERTNWGALGILWIVYGIARLLAAVVLVVYSGVATVMFGALLTRVPNPFFLMAVFHFCYVVAIIVSVLAGLVIQYSPISPMKALFWSAVINGIVAVPLMAIIILIASNTSAMGRFTSSRVIVALGWVATAIMGIAAAMMFIPG